MLFVKRGRQGSLSLIYTLHWVLSFISFDFNFLFSPIDVEGQVSDLRCFIMTDNCCCIGKFLLKQSHNPF